MPKYKPQSYRGFKDIEFIWHGTNADPELRYNGISLNYWNVENAIYQECREDFGPDMANDDEFFQKYCEKHEQDIKEMFH